MLTSLFSSFYISGECHRFLHRGRARFWCKNLVYFRDNRENKILIAMMDSCCDFSVLAIRELYQRTPPPLPPPPVHHSC